MIEDTFQHSNISEEEMGALHSIHIHLNAIARIQRNITTGPSALFCVDCSEDIPEARRMAVQGCMRCVECQQKLEHKR